jgi:hypothetical protein
MRRRLMLLLIISLLAVAAAGCGPSEEELATMTASSWTLTPSVTNTPVPTNTPTHTPTPTPIPYDANLTISDQKGNPIVGASVVLADEQQFTGETGIVSFMDLPDESLVLSVSAPGYFAADVTETIDRGPNEIHITLENDPNGLLVINACAPGEKLLYMDDFQDGVAQEWDALENNLPGWSLEGDPGNPDDLVIAAREGASMAWLGQETYSFNNSVWRLKFKHVGSGWGHVNFRWFDTPELSIRYLLSLDNDMHLAKWIPSNHLDVGFVGNLVWDQWHLLEYSFYDGTVSVYIDGKEAVSWTDPDPWEDGTINFEPYPQGDSVFYYDDISVCELTAPFEPIPLPKTGINLNTYAIDAQGNPIPNTTFQILELADLDFAKVLSDTGSASWADLPGLNVTLSISSPGYKARQESLDLQKGNTTSGYTLERDEFGKLPSELCRPEEELAYAEDIQSGSMPGWDDMMARIDLNVPGLEIISEPENEGNQILHFYGLSENTHGDTVSYQAQSFGDSVLRFDAKGEGSIHFIVRWHATEDWNSAYFAFIYGDQGAGGRMEKMIAGNFVTIFSWNKNLADGNWHNFEISSAQGENQVWIDGRMMGRWEDPEPLTEGWMTIEHDFWTADAHAYYDNFAVCNLNAPFVSIFAEE